MPEPVCIFCDKNQKEAGPLHLVAIKHGRPFPYVCRLCKDMIYDVLVTEAGLENISASQLLTYAGVQLEKLPNMIAGDFMSLLHTAILDLAGIRMK